MRTGGFLGGAALGLALALLLIGASSVFSKQTSSTQTLATTEFAGGASNQGAVASNTTAASKAQANGAPQAQIGGAPAAAQTSSSASTSAGSRAAAGSLGSLASVSQAPRPSSTLSFLPTEGIGTLLGTLAPLLIGLIVAAAVYGLYARRQDASS